MFSVVLVLVLIICGYFFHKWVNAPVAIGAARTRNTRGRVALALRKATMPTNRCDQAILATAVVAVVVIAAVLGGVAAAAITAAAAAVCLTPTIIFTVRFNRELRAALTEAGFADAKAMFVPEEWQHR